MSYYEKYVKYKNKYIALKHDASAKNVVLQSGGLYCNNYRVYKNMLGTCWMVAIQTIFSFGDATSGLLEKNIKEVRNLKFLIERAKLIPGVEDILPGIFDPPKVDYLMNILRKFKERYKSKVYGVRNANYPHGAKLENKDRCELVIAKNCKYLTKDIDNFISGSSSYAATIISEYLFSNILSIFLLGWKTSFTNYYNCEFSNIIYNSDDLGIIIQINGHSSCFFVCNGVEKYYNDNDNEIIDCKWKKMLKKTSKHNCLYIQEKGCVLLLTDEEYNMRRDKSILYKIEILAVLSKAWRPNSFDNDMQHLIKGNYSEIKDIKLNILVGEWYNFEMFNIPNAIKHYEMASDQGNIWAQTQLGDIYVYDPNVKDIHESIKYYEMAADQGNIYAQKRLGDIYLTEPHVKDIHESIKYYEMAADQGDKDAQNKLGYIYETRLTVNTTNEAINNRNNSIKYYEMAADQGYSSAQVKLGDIYSREYYSFSGWTIYSKELSIKDIHKAIKYYEMAAVQGDISAQNSLGNIYMDEHDVKDIGNAIKYYEMAADEGDPDALYSLGNIYLKERDVKNIDKAIKYYKMAVDQGDPDAAYSLADIYLNEPDIKDIEQEKYYRNLARRYRD